MSCVGGQVWAYSPKIRIVKHQETSLLSSLWHYVHGTGYLGTGCRRPVGVEGCCFQEPQGSGISKNMNFGPVVGYLLPLSWM